jgi:hypothetical protein
LGNAILLTVVGFLEAALDGDDPLRAGHLKLQISIVGEGHELGGAWSTEEGVVDTGEINHLEGEWLFVEVVRLAEGDAELDAP